MCRGSLDIQRKTGKEEMYVRVGRREGTGCEGVVPPPPQGNTVAMLSLTLSLIVLLSVLKVIVFLCVCRGDLLSEKKGYGRSFFYSRLTAAGGLDQLC